MNLGIIEGFYGETWGWAARHDHLEFMAQRGLEFFIYAPKGDTHLRHRWREEHPAEDMDALGAFGEACARSGIQFGVGLTPYALHEKWQTQGRQDLRARLDTLKKLNLDVLGILFDDMRGDIPNLAATQADMLKFVADCGVAKHLLMCPTYYTDSPILDRLFGSRPDGYLRDLGAGLDDHVHVFWTGPKVVSTAYPTAHLDQVADALGRRPFIWDNYPVNDGPRMSQFLHLAAPDRPAEVTSRVAGLAINPMNQAWLSRIPMDAMARSLTGHDDGDQAQATAASIDRTLPPGLAARLKEDWPVFQSRGLDNLSTVERDALRLSYAQFDHPAARELVRWLNGEYAVSADILTDG